MARHDPAFLDEQQRIAEIEYDEALGDKITLLAAQINAATYRFLKLIGEFDRRGGWSGAGVKSCAHWLNWKCGIANSAARERVRVARCLDELPLINEAFEKGQLSYSKVRAMTRVATNENEDYLLMIAQHGTASHIEKLVRKYQRVEKSLIEEDQVDSHELRELDYYQDDDGYWIIRAKLPQEEGGMMVKAIDEIMNKQDKPLNPVPGQTTKRVSAETPSDQPEIVETCNFAQKRADALCAVVEHYIASKSDGELKTLAGHERCQVVLHLDVETLKHEHSGECGCGHAHHQPPNLDKQWITMENAKRFSCDASLLTVMEDKEGNVLNIGRQSRTVPPHLKRALDIRDETCRFPGCCESKYVEFHHIQHWSNFGETKKGNLIKLCRFHHRMLHLGMYDIEAQGDENNPEFVFKASSGETMPTNPEYPHTDETTVDGAVESFRQQSPDIDTRTGLTKWTGEEMDYSMAIEGLLWRRTG